jgi:predicted DNA-binding protein
MKRTNMYFPEQMFKRLSDLAKRTGLSVAELVRRAVDEFLKRSKGDIQ